MKTWNLAPCALALTLAMHGNPAVASSEDSARSTYQERAFHTRVGTIPHAIDKKNGKQLCREGNAFREAYAAQLADKLDQANPGQLIRSDMLQRKLKLKRPCS